MVQQHRIRAVRSFQGLGGAQLISLGSQHVYLGGKGTYLLKDLSSKVEGICGKWYGRGWPIGAGLCSLVCSLFLGDLIFFIRVSLRPSNYHLNFHTDKWEISLQLFDGFLFFFFLEMHMHMMGSSKFSVSDSIMCKLFLYGDFTANIWPLPILLCVNTKEIKLSYIFYIIKLFPNQLRISDAL